MKKKPTGLIFGLIGGACIVLFMTGLYKGGVEVYLGPLAWLGYFIMIGFAVAATQAEKKANGGTLEFVQALKTCFTVFVIVLAAQTLFIWLLVNHLDTHFKEVLRVEILKRTEVAFKYIGYDQQKINELMTEERSKDPFMLGGMCTTLAFVDIIFFMISLLIAAIVKKKKEEFRDT
ncbi:MAG TPA: DUF4199 domain-containing protein [Puia sp.]